MHLLLENVVQNLIKLWTGKFPGIPAGQDFEIAEDVWKAVGVETAEATQDIPAAFVRVLGNIENNSAVFTAESWCFWFMYLAPILLKNCFPHQKYYNYMVRLVDIMKFNLKFVMMEEEIVELDKLIIDWVKDFEK
jgi:hypothetical protein